MGGEVKTNVLKIDPGDNVAVALREIPEGECVAGCGCEGLRAREVIPRNHKVAIGAIAAGGPVIKYGERIGAASRAVAAGEWVPPHNLAPEEG